MKCIVDLLNVIINQRKNHCVIVIIVLSCKRLLFKFLLLVKLYHFLLSFATFEIFLHTGISSLQLSRINKTQKVNKKSGLLFKFYVACDKVE